MRDIEVRTTWKTGISFTVQTAITKRHPGDHPIDIPENSLYHWDCRRFCSVVRVGRDRTGDLTEEMSGPKPTFYLL
jgi:hypothetical protein